MDLAMAPRSCWLSIFFLLLLCLLPRPDSGGRLSGHRLPEPSEGSLVASTLLLVLGLRGQGKGSEGRAHQTERSWLALLSRTPPLGRSSQKNPSPKQPRHHVCDSWADRANG